MIEVLSTGGDASLGGDDWDKVIMQWLIKEHLRPARVDCRVGGSSHGLASSGRVVRYAACCAGGKLNVCCERAINDDI